MALKRLHIYYSGAVQGVGFRYTAERLAGSLGLVGWVKNLRDGRVEALCEGDEAQLKDFLEKISGTMGDYIVKKEISWNESTGEFSDFRVRFS